MLTRKHVSALVHMPDLNPDKALLPYPNFALNITDYDLKSPYAEKLQLRFGHQMEIAFANAIERLDHLKIIAQNLQCIRNGETKGEIDFILDDEDSRKFYHVELAVKFYLYVPFSENEIECFIGPNKKDLLSEKLEKMRSKQFPILFEKEIEALLKPLKIEPKNIIQQSYFKAFVFIPFDGKAYTFHQINNDCVVGYYLNLETLESQLKPESNAFLPEKLDWIADPNHHQEWHEWETVKSQIVQQLEKKNAPMVWIKNQESVHRYFVIWWL